MRSLFCVLMPINVFVFDYTSYSVDYYAIQSEGNYNTYIYLKEIGPMRLADYIRIRFGEDIGELVNSAPDAKGCSRMDDDEFQDIYDFSKVFPGQVGTLLCPAQYVDN